MFDLLIGKTQPKAILDYCKDVHGYLSWLAGIGREPDSVGSLVVCSFLRLTLSRGKSVPVKVKCALTWFETKAKIHRGDNNRKSFVPMMNTHPEVCITCSWSVS